MLKFTLFYLSQSRSPHGNVSCVVIALALVLTLSTFAHAKTGIPHMPVQIWVSSPDEAVADPEVPHLKTGFKLLSGGYFEKAAAEFDKCPQLRNVTVDALVAMSLGYQELGRHDKALALLTRAIEHPQLRGKPKDRASTAAAYRARAGCYDDLNRLQEACEDFKKAAELNTPAWAQYDWEGAADAMRKQKKYTEAMALFAKVQPPIKSPWYYGHRGMCLKELGRLPEAVSDFSTGLEKIFVARKTEAEAYGFLMSFLYEQRAAAYEKLGKKQLAAADRKTISERNKGWATDLLTPDLDQPDHAQQK
jgi:tetratricopeptide (TPR) repeat protein